MMQSSGTAVCFLGQKQTEMFLMGKTHKRKYFLWIFPTNIEEEMMQSNQIKSNGPADFWGKKF